MKRETKYLLLAILLFLAFLDPTAAQTTETDAELFRLPEDYYLTFSSMQKDAPVSLDAIYVLVKRNHSEPFLQWTLKNNSAKTVRRFVVTFKIRENVEGLRGTGGAINYDFGTDAATDLILPNTTFSNLAGSTRALPNEIRKMFEIQNKPEEKKFIVVYGMVKKVVFSDGTVYEDRNDIFEEL